MHSDQSLTIKELKARYEDLLISLRYAVHELPAGVLYGKDGANPKQCAELMDDLNEFERVCLNLQLDQNALIEGCRWHFQHYAHYLSRRRHFQSYREYIEGRGGPLRVTG